MRRSSWRSRNSWLAKETRSRRHGVSQPRWRSSRGIAAADAACCVAVGRRSRGQDHKQAVSLLGQVSPPGDAARNLQHLLDLKDTAQYGIINITPVSLQTALRQAKALVDFAVKRLRG